MIKKLGVDCPGYPEGPCDKKVWKEPGRTGRLYWCKEHGLKRREAITKQLDEIINGRECLTCKKRFKPVWDIERYCSIECFERRSHEKKRRIYK